jgi:hypothetical protein
VLRISIQDDTKMATLKLEGKLVGPWVDELYRLWSSFGPSLGTKKLRLDICGITFVDKNGTEALRKIFHLADAQILADTPLTRHFAAEARRKMTHRGAKEI